MPQDCGGTLLHTFTFPLLTTWVQNADFVVRCGPTHSLPSGLETIPVFPPGSTGNLSPLKGLCGPSFPSEFTERVAAEDFNSKGKPSEQNRAYPKGIRVLDYRIQAFRPQPLLLLCQ